MAQSVRAGDALRAPELTSRELAKPAAVDGTSASVVPHVGQRAWERSGSEGEFELFIRILHATAVARRREYGKGAPPGARGAGNAPPLAGSTSRLPQTAAEGLVFLPSALVG